MSQWFDMWSVENPSEQNEIQKEGLRESIGEILDIIQNELMEVLPERIILGGISQGCATAIHALMNSGIRLGGFIGLCSWLPFHENIASIPDNSTRTEILRRVRSILKESADNFSVSQYISENAEETALETPVFLSHSEDDEVVPIDNGKDLYKSLQSIGFPVTWNAYEEGGHWINEPQGVDDIAAFLCEKVGIPRAVKEGSL